MPSLAESCVAAGGAPLVADAALDEVLARHVAEGQAAWPGVAVEPAAFASHLGARLGAEATLAMVGSVRGSDVYLALACAGGNPAAIAAFEAAYFGEIARAAAKTRASDDLANEVRGKLRRVLFVAEPGRPAAVSEYAGRGDLRGWIRVIATRDLIHAIKKAGREVPSGDDALFDVLSPGADPELAYIREMYRTELEAAFRAALGALTSKQRSLLRYQLVEGMTVDDVGALHGVHRATAARWIADARDPIADKTREELAKRLGATSTEVESIIRLVKSRIDVSLERMIG